jgi:hypothetical protein
MNKAEERKRFIDELAELEEKGGIGLIPEKRVQKLDEPNATCDDGETYSEQEAGPKTA